MNPHQKALLSGLLNDSWAAVQSSQTLLSRAEEVLEEFLFLDGSNSEALRPLQERVAALKRATTQASNEHKAVLAQVERLQAR